MIKYFKEFTIYELKERKLASQGIKYKVMNHLFAMFIFYLFYHPFYIQMLQIKNMILYIHCYHILD